MRKFKWPGEEECFFVDDSTEMGKEHISDLLKSGAVEVKSVVKKPTMAWKINDIREYLADNNIDYDRGDSKKELLARV